MSADIVKWPLGVESPPPQVTVPAEEAPVPVARVAESLGHDTRGDGPMSQVRHRSVPLPKSRSVSRPFFHDLFLKETF